MSKIRVQVITRRANDLAIDHIVNTVYFDDFNVDPTAGTNWQAFADQVKTAFKNRISLGGSYGVETRCYDMADAKPRPIKATSAWQQNTDSTAPMAPREVSLCLSYYSERNVPRFRGRIYIGPFTMAYIAERPGTGVIGTLSTLATGLRDVGGLDVDWLLYSPTRNAFSKVTNTWIDDEWDTVRSRGRRALSRTTAVTNE